MRARDPWLPSREHLDRSGRLSSDRPSSVALNSRMMAVKSSWMGLACKGAGAFVEELGVRIRCSQAWSRCLGFEIWVAIYFAASISSEQCCEEGAALRDL